MDLMRQSSLCVVLFCLFYFGVRAVPCRSTIAVQRANKTHDTNKRLQTLSSVKDGIFRRSKTIVEKKQRRRTSEGKRNIDRRSTNRLLRPAATIGINKTPYLSDLFGRQIKPYEEAGKSKKRSSLLSLDVPLYVLSGLLEIAEKEDRQNQQARINFELMKKIG